jgi:hypothetical protein
VEGLVKLSRAAVVDTEETLFGKYVAQALKNVTAEKRGQLKMKIMGLLCPITAGSSDQSVANDEN